MHTRDDLGEDFSSVDVRMSTVTLEEMFLLEKFRRYTLAYRKGDLRAEFAPVDVGTSNPISESNFRRYMFEYLW